MYIAMNMRQTPKYWKMEQFVVRNGFKAGIKTLSDFKGAKLMTAPGPANFNTAKARCSPRTA